MESDSLESESTGFQPSGALRVGNDIVQVSRIAQSIADFGERFTRRLFTEGEIAYSSASPALQAERFAARFAAKEATIKALSLTQTGLNWKQIEVRRAPSGYCALTLYGVAKAAAIDAGISALSLSLSHDGDYAFAVVVAWADAAAARKL